MTSPCCGCSSAACFRNSADCCGSWLAGETNGKAASVGGGFALCLGLAFKPYQKGSGNPFLKRIALCFQTLRCLPSGWTFFLKSGILKGQDGKEGPCSPYPDARFAITAEPCSSPGTQDSGSVGRGAGGSSRRPKAVLLDSAGARLGGRCLRNAAGRITSNDHRRRRPSCLAQPEPNRRAPTARAPDHRA